MTAPRLFVTPPTFTPLPYGLLSVVQPRYDEPDGHWRNGVTYRPLCGAAASTYDPCIAVTGAGQAPLPPDKTATADIDPRGATAFTVYAEIECSAVGWYEQAQQRAGDALARFESHQVERAFWTGAAGGQPVVYPHLAANAALADTYNITLQTAATTVTGAALDPVEAVGLLEAQLAACYDGVGVLHVPMLLIPALADHGLIQREGPRLRTPNGNSVAAGAGYPGTSPAGAAPPFGQTWIYATGAVFAYRSAPFVNPAPSILNRAKNTVTAIAERTYVLGWDCCHYAALVSTGGAVTGSAGSPT